MPGTQITNTSPVGGGAVNTLPENSGQNLSINPFPDELILHIFSLLAGNDPSTSQLHQFIKICLVNKKWGALGKSTLNKKIDLIRDWLIQTNAIFEKEKWNMHLGDVGEVPKVPRELVKFLISPCTIWPGKRRFQTWAATLIPATVNGKPFNSVYLGELGQNVKNSNKRFGYDIFWESAKIDHGTTKIEKAYFIAMTRDVLPNSRGETRDVQIGLAAQIEGCRAPYIHEATTIIFTRVISGELLYTRTEILTDQWTFKWTFTCVQEMTQGCKLVAGGLLEKKDADGVLARSGLGVGNGCESSNLGVSSLREFKDLGS